jgi:recombination protein RecT
MADLRKSETSSNSGERLRAAATGQAIAKKTPDSFPAMLTAYRTQIANALPKHINPDRMLRVALTCFRQNPKLAECDPKSVFACVVMGAQLGLEPGILGQAYLIPYKGECTFVPGWQGMVDIVNRSGRASVWTGAVYGGDEFDYQYGSSPSLTHKPGNGDQTDDNLTHVYAIGRVKGAEFPVIEVWSKRKVQVHRDRYNKVGGKHYSYNNFEMYGRKVALNQVLKYMPKSIEMNTAQALSYGADIGQPVTIADAIEGAFVAAPPADQPPTYDAMSPTDAIARIKDALDFPSLKSIWEAIVNTFDAQGETVPLEVEAEYQMRKEKFARVQA